MTVHVASYRPGALVVLFDPEVSAESVADECRAAALAFVDGANGRWHKRELAMWLANEYAMATRHAGAGERVVVPVLDENEEIAEEVIATILSRARAAVVASLEGSGAELVSRLMADGLVKPALDNERRDAWLPVNTGRGRLADRVAALFAVDWLVRPKDYKGGVQACSRCDRFLLGDDARALGHCTWHRAVSGIDELRRDEEDDDDVPAVLRRAE